MTTNRLAKSEHIVAKTPQQLVDEGNVRIEMIGRDRSLEWVLFDGAPMLRWKSTRPLPRKHVMDRRGQAMTLAETDELNALLEKQGANARYRSDGTRYMVNA